VTPDELVAAARAWRDEDPDPGDRAEIDHLLAQVEGGGAGAGAALEELRDRFGARLEFGTAGLRGAMGAGPNRMNRATVIRATAGLASYLVDTGHDEEPVMVGYDARHRSSAFAADAAAVLAAAGFPVRLGDRPLPTPVAAFGVTHLGCCAGIQITASHNPPADNGYKVYLGDGAQIAPPIDTAISDRIAAVGALDSVARAPLDDPRVTPVGKELIDAYVTGAADLVVADQLSSGTVPRPASRDRGAVGGRGRREIRVVYTPLHGVGRDVVLAVFERAEFERPHVVAAQGEPDPGFPTVAFPNPEEPGALDLALAAADEIEADVILANDPDADRLAVVVPTSTDGEAGRRWRVLTGDEIGVLLADWLLTRGTGGGRLVVTTVVSSSMLGRLAAARGVAFAETLTGFKWIARAAFERPELRFVFGYEEALGYSVGTLVRDKDGITAAGAMAELIAFERQRGRTVLDRLDDLARELGVHATGQRSLRFPGVAGATRMRQAIDRLASAPPASLDDHPLTEVEDLRSGQRLPPTDGIVLRADGRRLIVRPSGTEPKLKCYAEAVVPVGRGMELGVARQQAAMTVAALLDQATNLVE
jgi:phosphomannomutase